MTTTHWWESFLKRPYTLEGKRLQWMLPLIKKAANPQPERPGEHSRAEKELLKLISREDREVEVQRRPNRTKQLNEAYSWLGLQT